MRENTGPKHSVPALVILYNHRYDRNIETLERIYRGRFTHIYHLMPFYDGDRPNVIPVYENSYYFEGYIAQGLQRFYRPEHSHYLFVADDLFLNPAIDESNYRKHLRLDDHTSFLPGFIQLHERTTWWPRLREAIEYRPDKHGVEVRHELPDYEEALRRFGTFRLEVKPLRSEQVFRGPHDGGGYPRRLVRRLKQGLHRRSYTLSYPLVGSYADLVVVAGQCIQVFCHYCGVFAATDLFAELAVPTALVLSASEIVTEKDLLLRGKALWTQEEHAELLPFQQQLANLLSGFPRSYLYLHPVKLSTWGTTV